MFLKLVKVLFCKNVLRRYFRMRARFCVCPKRKYATTVKPTSPAPLSFLPSSLYLSHTFTHLLSLLPTCLRSLYTQTSRVSLSLSHTYSIRHFGKKVLLAFFQSCSCSYYLVSLRRRVNTHTLPPSKLVRVLSLSLFLCTFSLCLLHIHSLPVHSLTLSQIRSQPLGSPFSVRRFPFSWSFLSVANCHCAFGNLVPRFPI